MENADKEFELGKADEELYIWQYGGDSFMSRLFKTMSKADTVNLNKLAKGFPEEVRAYRRYISEDGYWNMVKRKFGNFQEVDERNVSAQDDADKISSFDELTKLSATQFQDYVYRVLGNDYFGVEFNDIEVLKSYIMNSIEDHGDYNNINIYLKKYNLKYDDGKLLGDFDDLANYCIDTYPMVSTKYPELINTALHMLQQTKGE